MDSPQKCEKVLEDSEDRISNLPDSVLCYILSFLPTKDAGRTSVLSTRWKYLFISSPNLDFDDSFRRKGSRHRFVNFIYGLLALRGPSQMNRFRLKCDVYLDVPHVNTWVSAAVRRNVQELDIDLQMAHNTGGTNLSLLPYDLFTCRTLVVLKLDVDYDLNVPSNVSLPRLKTLHLQYLSLQYDSFKRMLSGCPVLEDLLTCDCRFEGVQIFDISVSTLKRLALLYAQVGNLAEVVIDAPYLQYLRYEDDMVRKGYTLKGLTCLVEAHLCIELSAQQETEQNLLFYAPPVAKIFEAVSKVVSLHLTGYSVSVLEVIQRSVPTFPNLIRLEVDSHNDTGLEMLAELLRCSPNLEVLVVGHVYKDVGSLTSFRIFTGYLSLRLKEVELHEFTGSEHELEVVEYLLESAESLEKMTIGIPSSRRKPHISKKLLTFPRRSRTCRIFVTGKRNRRYLSDIM
ncbi:F-box protein At4g22280-like [Malania oleifera]|uniref:F-box protein At4g22280-like n=1 Tax=Malania oleifera TaxID=397392 RepID=UPI0025ADDAA7|nr:F-box protein At4g22280-like [Malania oleifera]XP_057972771.1 F-box protein At4g22280-like [Malania oleifera]XP_057972788.1 F-box protein At4g22280-like [Malania oleifera]XP_057972816.1 F-box protein At4g22280-like [Malania oleifera]XP_057972826.1 F-box protein At4g22280-like [Malania oleifera]